MTHKYKSQRAKRRKNSPRLRKAKGLNSLYYSCVREQLFSIYLIYKAILPCVKKENQNFPKGK